MAENLNLRDMAKQLLEVVITEYYMIPWKRDESDFCILFLNFPFKGILFYLRCFISRNCLVTSFNCPLFIIEPDPGHCTFGGVDSGLS